MNEKNVRTTLDNTVDDIQEARDDNECDDAEEEADNEDEEHSEGPGMLQQECKTRWSSTHPMGDMLQQECKTRWSSTHAMDDSLMTMPQFQRLSRTVRQYLHYQSVPALSGTTSWYLSTQHLVRDSLAQCGVCKE
jgi:hypothetical protein